MNIATAGLELIKAFESCRLKAYMPTPDDVPTIGWGHTKGVQMGDTCTQEEADAWLLEDVAGFEDAVRSSVRVPITQNQFDALVSLAYNIGAGAFRSSTLLRKLNAGDHEGAARELPRWDKQAGKPLAGLTRRRAAERALFESP
jgi:GH24 family phage-related lysozyme (muramidase)